MSMLRPSSYPVIAAALLWFAIPAAAPAQVGMPEVGVQPSSSESASFDTTVVARIDEVPVYLGEVLRAHRLRPVWQRGQQMIEALSVQLDQVIDERLLAVHARKMGLDRSEHVEHHLRFIEDREVNRALYREEILGQIDVSDSTLARAYTLGKRRIVLRYVRTADRARATQYAELLRSAPDSLQVHPADDAGTTDWLAFGDLNEVLDDVFLMELGDVIGPVWLDGRFSVVRLEKGEVDVFMSEMDFAEQKSRLRRRIEERAAAPLAARFVADLMADKSVRLEEEAFLAVSRHLADWLEPELPQLRLDEERVDAVRAALPLRGDEVVVRFDGGSMTATDVLRHLASMPSSLIRPGRPVEPQLRDAIGVVVRNHFIALEGRRRGFDARPDVRREVDYFQNQYLAGQLRVLAYRGVELEPERLAAMRDSMAADPAVHPDNLAAARLEDNLRKLELARWETELVDRLRRFHQVDVFRPALADHLPDPTTRIHHDPVPLIVRDIFH